MGPWHVPLTVTLCHRERGTLLHLAYTLTLSPSCPLKEWQEDDKTDYLLKNRDMKSKQENVSYILHCMGIHLVHTIMYVLYM